MTYNSEVLEYKIKICGNVQEDYSLFGSFPDDSRLEIRLKCDGAHMVTMVIHSDGLGSPEGEHYMTLPMIKNDNDFSLEVTPECLRSLSCCGLYYYRYEVLYDDYKLSFGGEQPIQLQETSIAGERQLLLYRADYTTPNFIKQGLIYHVFVDRFRKSGKCSIKPGCRINTDWEKGIPEYPERPGIDFDNREFFGGDLFGLVEKLPYLVKLGVKTIYLSPIFESPSNHKYDTADYSKVDEMFGGEEALKKLIGQSKKMGITVILDGVFNHTGDDSVYFNRKGNYPTIGAYQSIQSPFYSWYQFEKYPDLYNCWWGVKILPKVNCDNLSYRSYMFGENGIIRRYMRMGIGGFRLDVADELSSSFIEELRKCVRSENDDGLVLGEVWEDASNKIAYSARRRYFCGEELDSVMNYPLRNALIHYIRTGDCLDLEKIGTGFYRRYPKCVSDCLMNFLGTHDTDRIITALVGEESTGKSNAELSRMTLTPMERKIGNRQLKCAFMVLSCFYGVPSIFYGDEVGLEGYGDPFCRRPFPWKHMNTNLLLFIRQIGKLRNEQTVLQDGLFRVLTAENGIFAYTRYSENFRLFVICNASKQEQIYTTEGTELLLKTDNTINFMSDNKILLPPMSCVIVTD